jgi:hypothetical protein
VAQARYPSNSIQAAAADRRGVADLGEGAALVVVDVRQLTAVGKGGVLAGQHRSVKHGGLHTGMGREGSQSRVRKEIGCRCTGVIPC